MNSSTALRCAAAVFATLSCLGFHLRAEDPPAKWYELEADQKLIVEVTLEPGESKPVEVAAKAPLIVGFETDISQADNAAYAYPKPSVFLRSKQSEVSSPKGASTLWEVHGGKISLKVENKTRLTLRVAFYQGPKPADWAGEALP